MWHARGASTGRCLAGKLGRARWLAALLAVAARCAGADVLSLTTEDFSPPFQVSADQRTSWSGISADKLAELMRRARQAYVIAAFPWARAYQMALQLPNTCVFSTTRTAERESLFLWIGPLAANDWAMFGRAGDVRRPAVLEDVRGAIIGGYHDDSTGLFLKARGFRVDVAATDAINLQKLLNGRIDYWATGISSGQFLIAKNKAGGKIVPYFSFQRAQLYLACHKSVGAPLAERLNRILQEMERDGSSAAIERRYQ